MRLFRYLFISICAGCIAFQAWSFQAYGVQRGDANAVMVLSKTSVRFGGVLFTAETELAFSDDEIGSSVGIDDITYNDGRFCLIVRQTCFGFEEEGDLLARLISFVRNNASGAYTAYDLSPQERLSLGMRPCEFVPGECALEFLGQPELQRGLYALDFSGTEAFEGAVELKNRLNARIPEPSEKYPEDYEVIDEYSNYLARLMPRTRGIEFSGDMLRFNRSSVYQPGSSEPFEYLYVRGILRAASPPLTSEAKLAKFETNLDTSDCGTVSTYAELLCAERESMLEFRTIVTSQNYETGMRMSHYVGLFRRLKADYPDEWEAFTSDFFSS